MTCDTYCCNHGCNQGRDCPARVAKVAKVGKQVDLSRVQLHGTEPKRRAPGAVAHLVKRLAQWAGALAVVAIWMLACAATDQPDPRPAQHTTQWESA